MTRKQEILQQANAEAKANRIAFPEVSVKKGFIHGAEWADKTIIDKACALLNDNLLVSDLEKYSYNVMTEDSKISFINDFRKALEE